MMDPNYVQQSKINILLEILDLRTRFYLRFAYIPGTLDFGLVIETRGKMAHIFITKPRQNLGYAYVCFFDLNHFSCHIEPAKPKRPRYTLNGFYRKTI